MNGNTSRLASIAVAGAGLLFGVSGSAHAQQAGAPEASTPSGAQSAEAPQAQGGIQDIVVTARRAAESSQRVPIAITTVTAKALTDLSVRDVLDVQKVAPGLFISSVQVSGKARLGIRGQGEADDRLTGDRSVGVYIDGASFEHDYGLTSALVDVAQIEVLKGPQGTLFGKNTTGGALNITTQHPTYDLGGYVDLLYGSYDKKQAVAALNVPLIADKLAIRAVGQIISRDGYYREFDGHKSNDDRSKNGRLLIRADPVENVHILLSGDYIRLRDSDVHLALTSESLLATQNTATGVLGAAAKQLGLNPALAADRLTAYNVYLGYFNRSKNDIRLGLGNLADHHDNLDNWGLSANIAVEFGGVTARSITAYRHLNRSLAYDLDNTPLDLFSQHQTATDGNFSQELQLSSIDGTGLDWQAGLYYNRETGDDYSQTDQSAYINANRAVVTESGIVSSSKAAYAQAVYNFTPTLRATGGIRYTHDYRQIDSHNRIDLTRAAPPLPAGGVSKCNLLAPALGGPTFPDCSYVASTSNNKLTWLASADWRPVRQVMLYGSVSTGYRAGAFTQPGNSAPITTVAANDAAFTPYLPETVTNYEIGFKSDLLDRRLRVNGAAFSEDYKNIQVRVRDAINGVLVTLVRNAAKAKIYGGELEITAVPVHGLTLTGGAAYLHAQYKQYRALDAAGNVLDLSAQAFPFPKWTYYVGGAYELPLADGSVRLNANYSFKGKTIYTPGIADEASVTQTGYGLLDGRLSWNIESLKLDVAVFGKNLTDKRYRASGAAVGVFNIVNAGDPRTFGVQVRKTF